MASHVLTKVYDMRPLAVTLVITGILKLVKNLDLLLETFDVDHIMFTPEGSVNQMLRNQYQQLVIVAGIVMPELELSRYKLHLNLT